MVINRIAAKKEPMTASSVIVNIRVISWIIFMAPCTTSLFQDHLTTDGWILLRYKTFFGIMIFKGKDASRKNPKGDVPAQLFTLGYFLGRVNVVP
jgi:hypothetical protein